MAEDFLAIKNRLNLNRNVFLACMTFLYLGLIFGTITDIAIGDPLMLLTDAIALAVFTVCTALGLRETISYRMAVLACVVQTCVNFTYGAYVINAFHPERAMEQMANPQFLLLFGVFGVIVGMGVSRWGAVIFGGLGLGTIVMFSTAVNSNNWYYQHWFVLDSIIVAGVMTIVFYYRSVMEKLVGRLDRSLREIEYLKNRSEELHEVNKPFVMFGQNTAGLVRDFQSDLALLRDSVGGLRSAGRGPEAGDRLRLMSESIRGLNNRIEWVKYVASATPQRGSEQLNIRQLVESAVYPFRIQEDAERRIGFAFAVDPRLHYFGYRRWMLQAVENLIRCACRSKARNIVVSAELHGEVDPLLDLVIVDDGAQDPDRLGAQELAVARQAVEQMDGMLSLKADHILGFRACISLHAGDGAEP